MPCRPRVAINAVSGNLLVSLSTKREHLPELIALVGELLREPAWPADVLKRSEHRLWPRLKS